MVLVLNFIFSSTIAPPQTSEHIIPLPAIFRDKRYVSVFEIQPLLVSSKLCVLQWAGAHRQEKECYMCFSINRWCYRLLSWLVLTAFSDHHRYFVWKVWQWLETHVPGLLELLWSSPLHSSLICEVWLRHPRQYTHQACCCAIFYSGATPHDNTNKLFKYNYFLFTLNDWKFGHLYVLNIINVTAFFY